MALSESIRFAGDVNIDKIEIISSNGFLQNVTNQVIAIEIFEDLYSPFITGNIVVKDSLDLANLFPFVGEEFINLKIHTPTLEDKTQVIDSQFYIYKMSNRELMGDRNVVYQLHFISPEAIVDLNKKISKVYEGKISDIASKLVTDKTFGLETKKKLNLEPTPNSVKYISNFWSPIKNLNYIAGNAVNTANAASYVFFENRVGFNFVSLENLFKSPVKQDFVYDSYIRDMGSLNTTIRNVEEDYKRIVDVSIPEAYDYMDRSMSGMFSSKMISSDITLKRYVAKNFDMLKDFSKNSHLNAFPLASKKNIQRPSSLIINYQKEYGLFNGYTDVTNAKTLQQRISLLQQAEGSKIEITVPGRTDYTVGMKVSVKLYKNSPVTKTDSNEDITDNMFSGNYLISAINHYINREKHECKMELIKDSFIVDLEKGGKK